MSKTKKKTSNAPAIEAILGVEAAPEFQFAGRTFVGRSYSFSEALQLNKLNDETSDADTTTQLEAEITFMHGILNKRLVSGDPLSLDEVKETEITVIRRLNGLFQGLVRARDAGGAEGKSSK